MMCNRYKNQYKTIGPRSFQGIEHNSRMSERYGEKFIVSDMLGDASKTGDLRLWPYLLQIMHLRVSQAEERVPDV